mmetsp:Transcript_32002/g.61270  ORF Transcript_32002/g.61270 Transcript_32002/m.61270 type:complete len:124 (+) Transcript_32002:782-1153(+)
MARQWEVGGILDCARGDVSVTAGFTAVFSRSGIFGEGRLEGLRGGVGSRDFESKDYDIACSPLERQLGFVAQSRWVSEMETNDCGMCAFFRIYVLPRLVCKNRGMMERDPEQITKQIAQDVYR